MTFQYKTDFFAALKGNREGEEKKKLIKKGVL